MEDLKAMALHNFDWKIGNWVHYWSWDKMHNPRTGGWMLCCLVYSNPIPAVLKRRLMAHRPGNAHKKSLARWCALLCACLCISMKKMYPLYIYICVWRWNQINKCTNAPILSNVFVETITNSQSQSHQVARELLVRQACKTLFPFTWPQGQAQSSLALRQKLMEADTASSKNSNWLSQRQLCKTLEFRCNRNQS